MSATGAESVEALDIQGAFEDDLAPAGHFRRIRLELAFVREAGLRMLQIDVYHVDDDDPRLHQGIGSVRENVGMLARVVGVEVQLVLSRIPRQADRDVCT